MFSNNLPVGVVRANHLHHVSVEFNSFMNGIIQCVSACRKEITEVRQESGNVTSLVLCCYLQSMIL